MTTIIAEALGDAAKPVSRVSKHLPANASLATETPGCLGHRLRLVANPEEAVLRYTLYAEEQRPTAGAYKSYRPPIVLAEYTESEILEKLAAAAQIPLEVPL